MKSEKSSKEKPWIVVKFQVEFGESGPLILLVHVLFGTVVPLELQLSKGILFPDIISLNFSLSVDPGSNPNYKLLHLKPKLH